jgi:hypothetical protein
MNLRTEIKMDATKLVSEVLDTIATRVTQNWESLAKDKFYGAVYS